MGSVRKTQICPVLETGRLRKSARRTSKQSILPRRSLNLTWLIKISEQLYTKPATSCKLETKTQGHARNVATIVGGAVAGVSVVMDAFGECATRGSLHNPF